MIIRYKNTELKYYDEATNLKLVRKNFGSGLSYLLLWHVLDAEGHSLAKFKTRQQGMQFIKEYSVKEVIVGEKTIGINDWHVINKHTGRILKSFILEREAREYAAELKERLGD